MKRLVAITCLFALVFFGSLPCAAQQQKDAEKNPIAASKLDDIYSDESHCLTAPEIRSDKDSPISCYCRDAIADARYVWHTYLLTGRDPNLNGVELTLQINAKQMCGEQYDVHAAVTNEGWKWNGPEVSRTYPPDDVLMQIKPDSHGMIHYEYTVVLLHRDSSGSVIKTASYTVRDIEPLDLLKRSSKRASPKREQ